MVNSENKITKSLAQIFVACVLACMISCSSAALLPGKAQAEVRKADVVLGQTVDERSLSVSQSPNVDAEFAIVMDADGSVYFERNAKTPTQIASITKVMTTLVALDNAPLDTKITVSSYAASVGGSTASLLSGDVLTLEAALKGLMIPSGNDASVAIAEAIGAKLPGEGDSEERFIEAMNKKAAEIGMTDTVFTNPHGLDFDEYESDQRSNAYDVALMIREAMKNETIRSLVATPEVTVSVTHSNGEKEVLTYESTDELLNNFDGACGVKTGSTDLAGYCFAAAANRDGVEVYAVALKSPTTTQRFDDSKNMLKWYYSHRITYLLAQSGQSTTMVKGGQSRTVPLVAEVAHQDWIDKSVKATLADPDQSIIVFDIEGNVSQSVEYRQINGDIKVGDVVGTLTFKQRNEILTTVNMVATEDVAGPSLFEGIGIWWDRFFKGFSGENTVAESILINETPLINDKTSISVLS